jgi:hypothetical protein
MRRRVLLIVYNPVIPSEGGRKLVEVLGWHDPNQLAQDCAADLRDASGGLADFQIVERVEVDGWPIKADGFRYDPDTFMRCWRDGGGWHNPDPMDYPQLVADS